MQDFRATCTLAPHCSLIRFVLVLVGQSRLSDYLAPYGYGGLQSIWCSKGGESAVEFGETFGPYIRKRQGMVLVRETCEYHSREEEYMVLFWRDLWVPQQTRGMQCLSGEVCLCQLLT